MAVVRGLFDVVLGNIRGIVLLHHYYRPLQDDVCIENFAANYIEPDLLVNFAVNSIDAPYPRSSS